MRKTTSIGLFLALTLSTALLGCTTQTVALKNQHQNADAITPIRKNTLNVADKITIDSQPTGVIWQIMPKAPGNLVAQGNGIFISLVRPTTSPKVLPEVGDQPYISNDGRHWSPLPERIPAWGRAMIFADGWFYVVGESVPPNTTLGIVLRSQDGKHWQTLYSKARAPFTAIRNLNGGFIVTGQNGIVVSSRDGKRWHEQQLKLIPAFYNADYFKGNYIVTGDAMALYATKDLKHWENLSSENLLNPGPRNLQHNAEHLLLQTVGYLYHYHDNLWSIHKTTKGDTRWSYIQKLPPTSDYFLATVAGTVIQSKDGKNWQSLAQLQPADDQITCENRCIIYDYQIVKLPKPLN